MTPLKKKTLLNRFQSFIESTPFARQYDKRYESDRQMLQRIGGKFAVLFVIILMFDTLLDWFLGLIDLAIHLIHLIIQAIEYSLLVFLEYLFDFDQQQSETIIVNATVIFALYLVYRLILAVPGLTIWIKQYCLSAWLRYIKQESTCWQAMSLTHKIKWLSAYSIGTTCLIFFL